MTKKTPEYQVANMTQSLNYVEDPDAEIADEGTTQKKLVNYCSLSDEAKIVIRTILDMPNEFIDTTGVKKHFFKRWNSRFIVDLVITEIKTWLRNIS